MVRSHNTQTTWVDYGQHGQQWSTPQVPGGLPLALPQALPEALRALEGDATALADEVDALLSRLSEHQRAIAANTAVGLNRKVLKYFFTNPRKLASLARAAARG